MIVDTSAYTVRTMFIYLYNPELHISLYNPERSGRANNKQLGGRLSAQGERPRDSYTALSLSAQGELILLHGHEPERSGRSNNK